MIVTVTNQGFAGSLNPPGVRAPPKTPNATVMFGPYAQHLDNKHEQPFSKITQENSQVNTNINYTN